MYGYECLSVSTLEKATEILRSILPDIERYVTVAKNNCVKDTNELTSDQSAAIYLYTMQNPFFFQFKKALRAENRKVLKPWLPYLKLLITALEKLPSLETNVWRGIYGDVYSDFVDSNEETWWSINPLPIENILCCAFTQFEAKIFPYIQRIKTKKKSYCCLEFICESERSQIVSFVAT